MSKTTKHLCEYKKSDIKDDFDGLRKIVKKAKFVCRKCARAACDDRYLCKPEKL